LITQLVVSGLIVALEAIVLLFHFHFVSCKEEMENNKKSTKNACKFKAVHLDIIFFLFYLACDISSVLFFVVHVWHLI
jgi:hypothetical protein